MDFVIAQYSSGVLRRLADAVVDARISIGNIKKDVKSKAKEMMLQCKSTNPDERRAYSERLRPELIGLCISGQKQVENEFYRTLYERVLKPEALVWELAFNKTHLFGTIMQYMPVKRQLIASVSILDNDYGSKLVPPVVNIPKHVPHIVTKYSSGKTTRHIIRNDTLITATRIDRTFQIYGDITVFGFYLGESSADVQKVTVSDYDENATIFIHGYVYYLILEFERIDASIDVSRVGTIRIKNLPAGEMYV